MSDDPHEIARRLTPAQKRALLWLPESHDPRLLVNWRNGNPRWSVLRRLESLGLALEWSSLRSGLAAWSLSINPGFAVREIVKGGEG